MERKEVKSEKWDNIFLFSIIIRGPAAACGRGRKGGFRSCRWWILGKNPYSRSTGLVDVLGEGNGFSRRGGEVGAVSWRARNGVCPGSGEPNELGAALDVALKCATPQEAAHIREIDGHVAEQPEEESGRNAARDGQRVEQLDQDGGHEVERACVDGGEGVTDEEAWAPLPLLGCVPATRQSWAGRRRTAGGGK